MIDLERRLDGLSADFPFPPTPDLAGAAGKRLPGAGRSRLRLGRVAVALAAVAVALAGTLVLSPGARGALTDLFDFLPGVRIERVDELPSMPLADWNAYGDEVTLAEAERRVPFDVLLPESLGEPDVVYHSRDASGGHAVTVVYGDRSDARLVLSQWSSERILTHKLLGRGTETEVLDRPGDGGIWISGHDHVAFYLGLDSRERGLEGALAGNTLIWQDGDIAYRLEAGISRDRALELASGLR